MLYFSYVLQKGTIEIYKVPNFVQLNNHLGIKDPIDYFNNMDLESMESLEKEKRFFQNTYAPTGEECI